MRVSKAGLVLGIVYVGVSIPSALFGRSQADAEISTFFLQLPLIPAFLVASAFGVGEYFATASWLMAYGICLPVTAAALYAAGWLIGAASPGLRLATAVVVLLVLSAATIWPVPHR